MYRVVTLDKHGAPTVHLRCADHGRAVIRYSRIVLRQPGVHVRLIEGDELPGMPEKVIAQRFGDPCEQPCCIPLAQPWPEGTVTSS